MPKVDNLYSFTFFIMTPIFEWYVVRCASNNGYQKEIRLTKIEICAQDLMIIFNSIINIIGEEGRTLWPLNEHAIFILIINKIFI